MATTKKPTKKAAPKKAAKKAAPKRIVKDPSDLLCIAMVEDPKGGIHTSITGSGESLKRAIGVLLRIYSEKFVKRINTKKDAAPAKSRRKVS